MASTDALPLPRKNVAFRVTFPILDADGDLVTGAAGLDSEISKDGGTFADCTNEATEIATSSGMYYLDLTSTEMNADCVAVIVKTSTSGAKTTPMVFYPLEDGDWRVNVVQFGGAAGTFASGRPEVNVSHWGGTAIASAVILSAANIASDAFTAAKIAADVGTEIATAVWAATTRLLTAGTNIVLAKGTGVTGFTDLDAAGVRTAVGLAAANLDTQLSTIDGNVDSVLEDTGTTLPATLATIAGYLDTEIAAIKAVTDALPDSGALSSLAQGSALSVVGNTAGAIKATTDKLDDTLELDSTVYRFTANALEQAPAAEGSLSASDIADEVQTRTIAAVTTVNGLADNAVTAAALAADAVAEIQSGLATAAALTTVDGVVDAIQAKTDNLPSDPADQSLVIAATDSILTRLGTPAGADVSTDIAAIKTQTAAIETDTQDLQTTIGTPAGASLAADLAVIESQTDDIGTAGAGLTALASAADLATVAGYLDTEVAAIKAKTDNLPASPAATGDIPTATENADALLTRDWSSVTGEAARSMLNALRFLRNKWSIASGTLTVTKEDDTTSAWTGTVSTSASDPVDEIDPS